MISSAATARKAYYSLLTVIHNIDIHDHNNIVFLPWQVWPNEQAFSLINAPDTVVFYSIYTGAILLN